MADLIADSYGYWDEEDGWDEGGLQGGESFSCKCRYCRTSITMQFNGEKWRPFKNGEIHICQARLDESLDLLPDLTLIGECPFCDGEMHYQMFSEEDNDLTWTQERWFHQVCNKCQARGPKVSSEDELFQRLVKNESLSVGKILYKKFGVSSAKDWVEPEVNYSSKKKEHNPRPSDWGDDVTNNQDSVIGTRGYTKFNSDEWVAVTHHSNGSSTVHCGGPCGDMYVDEFGNS